MPGLECDANLQDFQQLLRPGIALVRKDGRNGKLDTHESFREEFGFDAELFPDFQALAGAHRASHSEREACAPPSAALTSVGCHRCMPATAVAVHAPAHPWGSHQLIHPLSSTSPARR